MTQLQVIASSTNPLAAARAVADRIGGRVSSGAIGHYVAVEVAADPDSRFVLCILNDGTVEIIVDMKES